MDGESGELMELMEEVPKNVLYCTVKRTKKINTVKPAKVDDPLKWISFVWSHLDTMSSIKHG